jgi:hypothetical protein
LKSFGTSEGGSFQKYFKDSEFSKDFEVSITYGGVEIAPSLLKSMDLDKAEELFMKFDNITTSVESKIELPMSEDELTDQLALVKFELWHKMPVGSASLEEVKRTMAGIEGFVRWDPVEEPTGDHAKRI